MNKNSTKVNKKSKKVSKSAKVKTAKNAEKRPVGRPMLPIKLPIKRFTVASVHATETKRGHEMTPVCINNHIKRAVNQKFAKRVDKIIKGQGHPTYVFELTARGIARFHGKKSTPATKNAKTTKKASTPTSEVNSSANTPANTEAVTA
jgi:hypothetical protein